MAVAKLPCNLSADHVGFDVSQRLMVSATSIRGFDVSQRLMVSATSIRSRTCAL